MFSLAYLRISVSSLVISRIYCDQCKLIKNPIVFVWGESKAKLGKNI